MNKLITVLVVILVAIGGFVIFQKMGNGKNGRVVVSITDAAFDMTSISEVTATVNKVELQSETTGWVTVSSATRTYNLLDLKAKGELAVAADTSVAAGTYNQIRVTISDIKVKTRTGAVIDAKLPSSQLKLNGNIVIKAGETSSVNLDFLASASLHKTGTGLFIFSPVVHMTVRSGAEVNVDSNGKVEIDNGVLEEDIQEGMDVNGEAKENFELNGNLEIDNSGMVKVRGL